jgi:outer membrane protein insertion porin family
VSQRSQPWFRLVTATFLTLLLSTCFALAARPAHAQGPAVPGGTDAPAAEAATVGRVSVTGNVSTDSTRILRTFDVATGTRFSQDLVKRGTRKLAALGLFNDVRVRQRPHDGVIDLVIEVRERPRVASIKFTGNKKREDVDLEKKLFLRAGETYSATVVQTQIDTLLKYYREEGFPRAKVTPKTDTLATGNELALTFQVEEGEKFRITRVEFQGAKAFPEKRLRKAMKTHAKGFFGGGDLKDETWTEDREKLEAWYHNHGYRDMSIEDISTKPGDKPQALTLVVKINEGPPYTFGQVSWSGNQVVETATLAKLWSKQRAGRYDKSRIDQAVAGAYGEYAEHGYLYLEVSPQETVRDSLVDVDLHVTEGTPSHVRRVSITGNKGTREHVIRRELDVHEGDLFRKSALVRSQGDIMRLGLFEEATPDFTPVESTDVDLVFKVKEKQVGTASAGAGYTSQTGLTGFLEIGHNNVLGNGQQLALHLERGNKVENYSLSFTEPWFHDAPTLLGFSAYSTQNILTEFDERRRGGSARIGRPLPWPDYSRGSIGFTLEKVKITDVRDSISLAGVPIGVDQLTSSFETNFVRNSADNPFYPTHGTRLTANDQFTGGPFFGDVHYHLHRYEGRAWFPSVVKHMTTMVRLRLGTVGQYTWRHGAIPDYARFRLGGGSTIDPLRGYMDYQIVPPQFITNVVTGKVIAKIDSVTTPGVKDTTYTNLTTRRRYPGGRYLMLFTTEQQFPIVNPLHGVLFFDAGNVWDQRREIQPFKLKTGAGFGLRMEIPILGNIGFDYAYGFNRDDGPRWQTHFLLGNVGF